MGAQALDDVLDRARRLESGGDLAGAAKALDSAAEAGRRSGLWHYARGALALRGGQLAEAVARFEAAVGLEPEVPEYRANLGAALLEQAKAGAPGALEKATKVLEEALRWAPKLPSAANNLGMACLLSGKSREALAHFEAALQQDPRHVPTLYNRAAALNAAGELDRCLGALEAVLAVDPAFAPALASRANTLKKLGRA